MSNSYVIISDLPLEVLRLPSVPKIIKVGIPYILNSLHNLSLAYLFSNSSISQGIESKYSPADLASLSEDTKIISKFFS